LFMWAGAAKENKGKKNMKKHVKWRIRNPIRRVSNNERRANWRYTNWVSNNERCANWDLDNKISRRGWTSVCTLRWFAGTREAAEPILLDEAPGLVKRMASLTVTWGKVVTAKPAHSACHQIPHLFSQNLSSVTLIQNIYSCWLFPTLQ
jgi:hypothetical protein